MFPRDARGASWAGDGVVTLDARHEALECRIDASEPGQLEALKGALARHLDRFAFREAPLGVRLASTAERHGILPRVTRLGGGEHDRCDRGYDRLSARHHGTCGRSGIVSLLWNAFGGYDYSMTQLRGRPTALDAAMGSSVEMRSPTSTASRCGRCALWAIGVWGSVARLDPAAAALAPCGDGVLRLAGRCAC